MDFVSVLNPTSYQTENSSGGNSAQAQIPLGPYQVDTLLLISATGSSRYQGATTNAGITLKVKAAGTQVVDDSFEGSSSNITFRAAASHNVVLKKGQSTIVEARVDPYGSGAQGNKDAKVAVSCFVLAVRSEGAAHFA